MFLDGGTFKTQSTFLNPTHRSLQNLTLSSISSLVSCWILPRAFCCRQPATGVLLSMLGMAPFWCLRPSPKSTSGRKSSLSYRVKVPGQDVLCSHSSWFIPCHSTYFPFERGWLFLSLLPNKSMSLSVEEIHFTQFSLSL